jgi:hypothetical protein
VESRITTRTRGNDCGTALAVRQQINRLFVRLKVEGSRLDIVRALRDAPYAAGHVNDLDAGAFRELTEQSGVEGNLDPVLRLVAPARLRVSDGNCDTTVSRFDDDEISYTGGWEEANRSFNASL